MTHALHTILAVAGPPKSFVNHFVSGLWLELIVKIVLLMGFVLTAMRVAYWATFSADGFEQAVVSAANLGGDADTNAAVTGALAGARFGASQIPQRWLEPLLARDHISGLATRLLRE